jgi:hypothetical protein
VASLPSIDAAEERADTWIRQIRKAIESDSELAPILERGCGWAAVGSIGRRETVADSDVDLVLLRPTTAIGVSIDDLNAADRRAREIVQAALSVKVSRGQDLTQPTRESEIACADRIGGEYDSRTLHTRRVLLLTESVAVAGDAARDRVRAAVFREYFSRSRSKGKHMLSLVNDVVRYYRTLMIDYKAKIDSEGKTWASRNVKLRHSRKYWFFATALALVAADRSDPDRDAAESKAIELLDLSPTKRLQAALQHAKMSDSSDVVRCFDHFLGLYGDPKRRKSLESLDHADRAADATFQEFQKSSDDLHRAMLDLIAQLPDEWRRDIIGHFLL